MTCQQLAVRSQRSGRDLLMAAFAAKFIRPEFFALYKNTRAKLKRMGRRETHAVNERAVRLFHWQICALAHMLVKRIIWDAEWHPNGEAKAAKIKSSKINFISAGCDVRRHIGKQSDHKRWSTFAHCFMLATREKRCERQTWRNAIEMPAVHSEWSRASSA